MFGTTSSFGTLRRVRRWCYGALAIACLGFSGCSAWHRPDYDFSKVDEFRGVPASDWSGEFRPLNDDSSPHAVTNKGMEIERSLGVR